MELLCYHCSATLSPDASYCAHCGAPQIRYRSQEYDNEPELSTPWVPIATVDRAGTVHWKLAIRVSFMVAVGVGILCSLLAAGSVLWVAVGAVVVVGIYRRKRPQAVLNPRIGARIGALVGILVAFFALAGNAGLLVIQRFGLHQGKQIDLQLTTIVQQAAEHAANLDPQAPVSAFTDFWLSSEGRIGLILLTMAFLSVLILLFAIAGGVLGAQVYRTPQDPKIAL